jgi:hypothetical protein
MINFDDIDKRRNEIPFGNSIFQNDNLGNTETPEHLYRWTLLQIEKQRDALQNAKYIRDNAKIDLMEIEEKILKTNGYEQSRLKTEKDKIEYNLFKQEKFIYDAEIEIMTHYYRIKNLPIITRKQYELSEKNSWEQKFIEEAKSEIKSVGHIEKGTIQALNKIGIDIKKATNGIEFFKFKEVENNIIKLLEDK